MELIVGKATDREMADVANMSAMEARIEDRLRAYGSNMKQHGANLREWFNGLEKRHKLEHGYTYQVRPNGDIVRLIPEQPPIAGADHDDETPSADPS
jgi:hypothetical protein